MSEQITIAAQTAWGEARGEGVQGMQAVLNVIWNRVQHPCWWGHDVASVCQHAVHGEHQFSCWNHHDPNYQKMLSVTESDPQYSHARVLAGVMLSGHLPDITGGADSYYEDGIPHPPHWANGAQFTVQIGRHRFYIVRPHHHPVSGDNTMTMKVIVARDASGADFLLDVARGSTGGTSTILATVVPGGSATVDLWQGAALTLTERAADGQPAKEA